MDALLCQSGKENNATRVMQHAQLSYSAEQVIYSFFSHVFKVAFTADFQLSLVDLCRRKERKIWFIFTYNYRSYEVQFYLS